MTQTRPNYAYQSPVLLTTTAATRWKKNADLSAFSQALEGKIEMLKPQKTIDRIKAFHEAVVAAATETVPKTAPGKKPTCHLSASVKAQIKTRNRLRRSIGTNRKEWIESCRGVRQKIEEERQKSWASFVQETEFSCDPSKLWRVFHAIGDSSPPTQPNEALLVNSKVLHSATAIARKQTRSPSTTRNRAS